MSRFLKHLQKFLDRWHNKVAHLEERSQIHANRRTIITLCLVGYLSVILYVGLIQPPDNFPIGTLVTVEEGSSLDMVADDMQAEGVVRSAFMLRILVSMMGEERSVRAGDYLFQEPKGIFSVARALAFGQFGLEPIRIRIHEGAMTKEMAVILDARLQRFNADRFFREAQPQEGYLFPDTYFFMPNATEDTVLEALRQNFDEHVASIPEVASSSRSLSDIVKMASIVEREARNPDDRRLIAGVLWNRIDRGMALQVDATFLYTIGKGTFDLTMKDLTSDSPYNTYVHKGLPPTAIGSPSLDSILAAAKPTKNSYLYYLADNSGVTHYSKTYEEHLRKKRVYLGS